jgi:hypothetical protein
METLKNPGEMQIDHDYWDNFLKRLRFKRSKAILHKFYKRYVRNINPLLVENNNPDQKPQELSFQEK